VKKIKPSEQVPILEEALRVEKQINEAQAKENAFLRQRVGDGLPKVGAAISGENQTTRELQKPQRIPGAELRRQISSHVLELMRRAQDLDTLAAEIGPLSEPAERMLSCLFYNSERKHF
jgi:hypothetical protein